MEESFLSFCAVIDGWLNLGRREKIVEASAVNVPDPSPCPLHIENQQFMPVHWAVFRTRVVG
jgi:hypothetical protein